MAPSNLVAEWQAARQALIASDRSLRRDTQRPPLSSAEQKAEKIIRAIRKKEAEGIWAAPHEAIPHPFPGMEFLTGKKIIEETTLFEILQKMPKGGLLHAHLDATVDVNILLQYAIETPGMHIRITRSLDPATLTSNVPQFAVIPQLDSTTYASLEEAPAESWVPIVSARDNFLNGGPAGFDKWALSTMMINPSEAYGTHNTLTKIWQKFMTTFRATHGIIYHMPIFEKYIRKSLLTSVEDGISYVEPRINFLARFMTGADGLENIPHRDWLVVFDRILSEVKEYSKQQSNDFAGAKIIYSTVRFITPEELEWYLQDCITLKKEFPHLIAGFDLVGDENVLHPLKYYAEVLLRFPAMQEAAGLPEDQRIPFIFHAGETLGDGSEPDENLYDAVLLGTKRIGHGFSIVKHPKIMEICRERQICIEVCPISNEVLRLTSSMPMHPLPIMINNGLPVALCSDDPAVFGNMGLTYDYFQVLAASEQNGLITLGELAKDSIKFSCLADEEKVVALKSWQRRWDAYIDMIVEKYGQEADV
ncbi:hypothetical protein EV122DRAFT_265877 [Schizophyllum commune]